MTKKQALNYLRSSGFSKEQIKAVVDALQGSPTKNDLGVDAISRAEVLKLMQDNWHTHNGDWAMQESMDDIRALPSVTPQEPKPMVEIDLYSVIKQKYIEREVLDKIRAEIIEEKECAYADFERYKVEYLGQDWEDVLDSLPQDDFRYGMERAIDIIDKYKGESEG